MYKLGLKLWSVNTDFYYDEAIRLYERGIFDYIELYVVPNTLDTLEKWKQLKIPFSLHAPHFAHNVNLAKKENYDYNKEIFMQVAQFEKTLKAKYTIIHGGIEGSIEETVRQLKLIRPNNFLIENKPYRAPLGEKKLCRGYSIEEIKYVLDELNCGFCLDIGHAICTANSMGEEPYAYLEKFNQLKPAMYHISGNFIDNTVDEHLHLHQGNYDIPKIFDIIDTTRDISIETQKDSKTNLLDFEKDVKYINEL